MKKVTGYLREVSDGQRYFHELATDDLLYINIEGQANPPFNKMIDLWVEEFDADEKIYIVPDIHPCWEEPSIAGDLITDKLKKHIFIARKVSPTISDDGYDKFNDMAIESAIVVEDYLRYYGGDYWDVKVVGAAVRGEGTTHPPQYFRYDINAHLAENDYGVDFNYFHAHGDQSSSYCGLGTVGGDRSVTFLNATGNCGERTMIHELGHNFGLRHAGVDEGDNITEYGDQTCIMGSRYMVGYNSPHTLHQKLSEDRDILVANVTQQFLLAPLERPRTLLHPNQYRHVKIGSFNEYLSLRKKRGTRYGGTVKEGVVYLHDTENSMSRTVRLRELKVGYSTTHRGTTIKFLEYDEATEAARLSITYGGDPEPMDIPMPVGFPSPINPILDQDHSGAWHDHKMDGQGFDIYVKDGKTLVFWYTYNQRDVERRYYIGLGDVKDGVADFDMYTTEDGTHADPTRHKKIPSGSGQLFFTDKDNGVFRYSSEEWGQGEINLQPTAPREYQPLDGHWWQPDKDGSGFGVRFYPSLNMCVMFWFNYGGRKPDAYPPPNQEIQTQRWYICDGKKQDDGSYSMDIREYIGGRWRYYDEATGEHVGFAKLTPVNDNQMIFRYDLNGIGIGGAEASDTLNLERLF